MTKASFDPRSFDDVQKIADVIRSLAQLPEEPKYGIICGSGFGHVADALEKKIVLPYTKIPGFPSTTVIGHSGNFVFGYYEGAYVVCQQGRFHPYEHHMDLAFCAMPVRVMWFLGVRTLIATNAVGAVNKGYRTGDFMVYKDHIFMPGMIGYSPLVGAYDKRWGERFVPSDFFTQQLRDSLHSLAPRISSTLHEGVYVMLAGPQYESTAELNYLRTIGADAVGMSVSHEAVTAAQLKMRVLGLSFISNDLSDASKCGANLSGEDVLEQAKLASGNARTLILGLIAADKQ